jgi:hypothetical protein
MNTPNDQVQQALNTLWQRNFLNLRAATQAARAQNRSRLDVGFELYGAALTDEGKFHDHAAECLAFLSSSKHVQLMLWTYSKQETVIRITSSLFIPNHIKVKSVNENKLSVNINHDPRKPHFDALIDPITGFDPKQGHWYWVHRLFEIVEETMQTQMSGLHIIKSREQFDMNPPSQVFRSPHL